MGRNITLKNVILRGVMTLILCIITNGIAFSSQDQEPPKCDFIEKFDTDGDGKVSEDEFPGLEIEVLIKPLVSHS